MLYFAVIGSQKAGTTWIYEYLKTLPEVCFPAEVKETFFFDKYYYKGLDWYFWHFKHCKENDKKGEVAPTYFDVPEVPERIYKLNKSIRIVVTLRNPYERSWSLYLHQLRYGFVKGTFQEAIKQDPRILTSSFYATHLKRWFNVFEKEQVLIMLHDELKNNPNQYIKQICHFLDIPFQEKPEFFQKEINPTELSRNIFLAKVFNDLAHWLRSYRMYWLINFSKKLGLKKLIFSGGRLPQGPTEVDYQIMEEKFEAEIKQLETMLNLDLSQWKRS